MNQTAATTAGTACSSPNVDLNTQYDAASGTTTQAQAGFVFAQSNNIYARTYDGVNRTNGTSLGALSASQFRVNVTAASSNRTYHFPDVAVGDNATINSNSGDRWLHFAYVERVISPSSRTLIHSQVGFVAVHTGAANTVASEDRRLVLSVPPPSIQQVLDQPRIAVPARATGYYADAYCVVVQQRTSATATAPGTIKALGRLDGVDFVTPITTTLSSYQNSAPVVLYDDVIIVAWQHRNTAAYGTDILQSSISHSGSGGMSPTTCSRVSIDYAAAINDQAAPCIAGRDLIAYAVPSTAPARQNQAMYGYYEGAQGATSGNIKCKTPNHVQLRPVLPGTSPVGTQATTTGDLSVYPNPATADAHLLLPAGALTHEVLITDLTGRVVARHRLTQNDSEVALRALLPASTPAGCYVVRVPAAPAVRPVRFQLAF